MGSFFLTARAFLTNRCVEGPHQTCRHGYEQRIHFSLHQRTQQYQTSSHEPFKHAFHAIHSNTAPFGERAQSPLTRNLPSEQLHGFIKSCEPAAHLHPSSLSRVLPSTSNRSHKQARIKLSRRRTAFIGIQAEESEINYTYNNA